MLADEILSVPNYLPPDTANLLRATPKYLFGRHAIRAADTFTENDAGKVAHLLRAPFERFYFECANDDLFLGGGYGSLAWWIWEYEPLTFLFDCFFKSEEIRHQQFEARWTPSRANGHFYEVNYADHRHMPPKEAIEFYAVKVFSFLLLLNTKNLIELVTVDPNSKKRESLGKKPLCSYHLCRVQLDKKHYFSSHPRVTPAPRLHQVQAHWKHPATPASTFKSRFCPPHWRGDEAKGVVIKDYVVT